MSAHSRNTTLRIADLPAWQARPEDRILIFAPHPDDETLATGGVIATARKHLRPEQIRVVIATNGDASRLAAMTASRRPPTRRQQRALARVRQEESLTALRILGASEEGVGFWGFPDSGLRAIWQNAWGDVPHCSGVTGFVRAEQARNAPESPYTAPALLRQILETLAAFSPTVIFTPHPDDAHPDHAVLAKFVLLAARMHANGSGDAPLLLAYPMWLQARPIPRSVHYPQQAFRLPARFTLSASRWYYHPYTDATRKQKARALTSYRSQAVTVRGLLRASARSSYETFGRLHPASATLPPVPGLTEDDLHHLFP